MRKSILLICSVCCILLCLYGCTSDNSIKNPENNISTLGAESEMNDSTTDDQQEFLNDVNEIVLFNEELMSIAVLQYPSQNDEWKYNVYDCYVEITGYIGENTDTLIIPDEIESLPVWSYNPELIISKIGETTLKNTVKSIIFPSNLLVIGEHSFSGFTNIKNITLPNDIIEIGKNAFYGCESLGDVSIPETLKRIGDGAFYGCSSLKQIVLPLSVEQLGNGTFDYTNNNDGIELTVYNSEMAFGTYGSGVFNVIKGYAGSTAAQYAAKGNIKFEVLE